MIIRFAVSNHLSIRAEQELSFVASPLKDVESGLLTSPALKDERLAPLAVIYGPNASGKSNVINALRFMRSAVLDSHNEWNPEGGVRRMPFALDPACLQQPSKFEIDFILDDVHYNYGFEATDEAFAAEWLDAYPEGRPRNVFRREGQEFKFGTELKKASGAGSQKQAIPQVISELTRPNSLFLSAAVQNNNEYLSRIGRFFRSWRNETERSVSGREASSKLRKDGIDRRVIDFLAKLDTGVVGYRRKKPELPLFKTKKDFVEHLFVSEFEQLTQKYSLALRESPERWEMKSDALEWMGSLVELGHRSAGGETVYLNLNLESAGTRRLLVLLSNIYRTIDDGSFILIDELDASLHTQACEAVLALFALPGINKNGAQALVTTHDTNLLQNRQILRRDQVWFTEKDKEGATHLYPLTDFRTRESDNLERGYIQGRYGAVPFTGDLSELLTAE